MRYNALSYTWGDKQDLSIIYVKGKPIQVTASLEQALKAARREVPQQQIDWGWQREEITLEDFGFTDQSNEVEDARLKPLVEMYNTRAREPWQVKGSDGHLPTSPENMETLLQDLEFLDERMKERLQGWYQLSLLLFIVAIQGVQDRTLGDKDEPVNFKARQYYYIQAAVEQEEILREMIEDSEKNEPSLKLVHDKLQRLLDILRAEAPQHLWIDALCINQQDFDEKNHQIPLMTQVYSKAAKVVVWLGPQADGSQRAIDLFTAAEAAQKNGGVDALTWISTNIQDESLLYFTAGFFLRPWFRRTWIIQEYVASGKSYPRFLCGETSLGARGLEWISKYLKAFLRPEDNAGIEKLRLFEDIRRVLEQRLFSSRRNYLESIILHRMRRRLLPWLALYRNCSSTDPRDKIYAFLGLMNPDACEHDVESDSILLDGKRCCPECSDIPMDFTPDLLLVDYNKPVVDVYASLVRSSLVATNSLNILSACQDRRENINRTWVPDWTTSCDEDLLSPTYFLHMIPSSSNSDVNTETIRYSASGDRPAEAEISPDLQYLKAKGVIWAEVCWEMPSPAGSTSPRNVNPAANFKFLIRSGELLEMYQKEPMLQESIRSALVQDETNDRISEEEFARIFDEWKSVIEEWLALVGTFREQMESIQSRMRFPAKDWGGLKIKVQKKDIGYFRYPSAVVNLSQTSEIKDVTSKSDSHLEKNTSDDIKPMDDDNLKLPRDFDEIEEQELKKQETKAIQEFWKSHEKMALAAVSKKLFSFFWDMQTSGKRFMRGVSLVPTAKKSPHIGTPSETSDGFGRGPIDLRKGDLVCVILGCDVPLIVRRDVETDLDEIVGPCYWQGVMYGEALDALERGDSELVEFLFR